MGLKDPSHFSLVTHRCWENTQATSFLPAGCSCAPGTMAQHCLGGARMCGQQLPWPRMLATEGGSAMGQPPACPQQQRSAQPCDPNLMHLPFATCLKKSWLRGCAGAPGTCPGLWGLRRTCWSPPWALGAKEDVLEPALGSGA